MALTKLTRYRAPLDGTIFRTMGNLNSVLRSTTRFRDDLELPSICNEIVVPLFVRMELYQAQKTRERPDGIIYGPVVRVGSITSPEIVMHSDHWSAGLQHDYRLDQGDTTDKWVYFAVADDPAPATEEVSWYQCSTCNEMLYRDDEGLRSHYSACIFEGGLVCQSCDVTGLVYDDEVKKQVERCTRLGNYLAEKYDSEAGRKFAGNIEHLNGGFCWGRKSQTRLFREDKYSFGWSVLVFGEDGKKSRGMNGGLIQHGPHPIEGVDGGYDFRTWDFGHSEERDATDVEIAAIHWSIHT